MQASEYTLARLVDPIPAPVFLDQYFEKETLVVAREQPGYFASLLTLDDIDRVITTLSLHDSDIQLVNAKDSFSADAYTYPSGMIDPAGLYQKFSDGATIILPQLHLRVPALADLCRALEREFSARFQTNIYLTPAGNSQGFKPHYDNHDVFVLQVSGTKSWTIYDTPVELPHRGLAFDPAKYPPGEVTRQFVLHPGDMVYIPRGVVHDAASTDQISLHITLGVMSKTWTDFLLEALSVASLEDPAFRRGLPAGFAAPGYDRTAAREIFRDLLRKLADAPFDGVLDHFVDDIVSTRHALLWQQMDQIRALDSLSLDSRAGVRPNLIYRTEQAAEHIRVACYGKEVSLPLHAAEPTLFALESRRFAVRDLPGVLDDAGKLVLVRRLVREGMLMLL